MRCYSDGYIYIKYLVIVIGSEIIRWCDSCFKLGIFYYNVCCYY